MTVLIDDQIVPRPEYPRPQWARRDWLCLNGHWDFEIDGGDSGLERGLLHTTFGSGIVVPFAPESEMSGIANIDFMEAVWYRRTVRIPAEWAGRKVLVHFGAADHDATVWIDGIEVGRHRGGFTPFTVEVPVSARAKGQVDVALRARDSRHQIQARGKQSSTYASVGTHYPRTTGIWQTVWLEPVPELHMKRPRITPRAANAAFHVAVPVSSNRRGHKVRVTLTETFDPQALTAAGRDLAAEVARADLDLEPQLLLRIPDGEVRAWSPAEPHLYGFRFELVGPGDEIVDTADSYAGLRGIAIDGRVLRINDRVVFQRLVLDQGFWPESLMTAPSDEALINDIQLSIAAGFNGARLHQRVPEERYLFHADRLGYLLWSEYGDWGAFEPGPDGDSPRATTSLVAEWLEAVGRDQNHPAIVGWCPLNETQQIRRDRITQLDDITRALFLATKAADPSRPALDASGYSHRVRESDVWDSHSYEQDPVAFAKQMSGLGNGEPFVNTDPEGRPWSVPYDGQPYFVSEFGGIWWDPSASAAASGDDAGNSWGYGKRVANEDEFYIRFAGLVGSLLEQPGVFGYCYTQLTDTFQEKNGIYRADRTAKLDVARIRQLQQQLAAAERGEAIRTEESSD